MMLLVILLFFNGTELTHGVMPGAAKDVDACFKVAAEYITAHQPEIEKLLDEGQAMQISCVPMPQVEPEVEKPAGLPT